MEFENHVAFVTGASSGIGRAAALGFARNGCNVAIVDLNPKGEETAAEVRKFGVRAFFQRCDTAAAAEVESAVQRTVKEFGRLDFAFNNAGIDGDQAPTQDCTIENWNKVVAVNLTGVFLCMKSQIPQMLKHGSGSIVNCSSIAGLLGFPNIPAYTASKHGVVGLTKAAALELAAKNVRVNPSVLG
jgi:NAD(P)-dependent dehydrogenase (short-subunit alcohol dehydrogenase family)